MQLSREQLTTEWGKSVMERAADELLELRDSSKDGKLSFHEFSNSMAAEGQRHRRRFLPPSFWKLAPLADVRRPTTPQHLQGTPHVFSWHS